MSATTNSSQRIVLSALACTVAFAVGGLSWHAGPLHDWFYSNEIAGTVYRPEGPWRSWVIPGTVLQGAAVAILFSRFPRSASIWSDAARFSAAIGAFFLAVLVLIPYGAFSFGSAGYVLGEGAYVVAQMILIACVLALTQRR
ncbi:MAG: hypothetical protein AAF721_23780 [Myxococcota bacterium]